MPKNHFTLILLFHLHQSYQNLFLSNLVLDLLSYQLRSLMILSIYLYQCEQMTHALIELTLASIHQVSSPILIIPKISKAANL